MLEIIVLGCGSSLGVPVIGCNCQICKSDLNYNKRTRCAIIIRKDQTTILVDAGFEIREQLIRAGIDKLDGVIITHAHADHIHGLDNLRVFPFVQQKPLEIFTDQLTGSYLSDIYNYLFQEKGLNLKIVDFYDKIKIGDIEVQLFRQIHGKINSIGIKIGDFAYSNDISLFPTESEKFLYNLKYWILDCRGYRSNIHHIGLENVLKYNTQFNPQHLYLTNMGHEIDYEEIIKTVPQNIKPLYDGYIIRTSHIKHFKM